MEQTKIEIVYKILMNDLVLNDQSLIQYGLSEEDIEEMVIRRILSREKNGTYKIFSVDKFRQYGVKLLLNKDAKGANICFRKCYELAPTCKNVCLQCLIAAVIREDYKQAFEIFANLEKIQPEKNIENNNLYLYLLSEITECPEEYQERISEIEFDDIMLPRSICNKPENEIRKAIYQNKFKYSYQLITTLLSEIEGYSIKFELIRTLIIKAVQKQAELKKKTLDLAKKEEYQKLLTLLQQEQTYRRLTTLETYTLFVTSAIVQISETGIIPTPTLCYTRDIYKALEANNFELALELNEEFIEMVNEPKASNILHILLVELNQIISETKKSSENIQTPELESQEEVQKVETTEPEFLEETAETELKEIEELAYYLSSNHINLIYAIKFYGILPEQVHLIKLIYARDYYIESNYEEGDKLIKEVENSLIKSEKVIQLLSMIKSNRDNYRTQLNSHTRSLTQTQ